MYVTYNNLFKLLIDKGLNKTEFAREVGISSNTVSYTHLRAHET